MERRDILYEAVPSLGSMRTDLETEIRRKLFHFLTLAYLWVYWRFGSSLSLKLLGGWLLVEGSVELLRLRVPPLNAGLMQLFGPIHRESEIRKISGVFWTGLGTWLVFFFFGSRPEVVNASILYLALGDAAAALIGKTLQIGAPSSSIRRKSWGGSFACFVVCALIGKFLGLGTLRLLAGAAAATALEFFPIPPNDNLWLPFGSAVMLWLIPF